MRSISFALIGPKVAEVVSCLEQVGFLRVHGGCDHRIEMRNSEMSGLYVSCWSEDARDAELESEYTELLMAIGGFIPTVHIVVDVSGRVAGDAEVRILAKQLLNEFRGFVFDDFLSYSHAWTLPEIERGVKFDGLGFFDYQGHFIRSKQKST
jgi:hypothetical protein